MTLPYWLLDIFFQRYCAALELVNMILAFIETRALSIFNNIHFLDMSESMVTMIMSRNLEVSKYYHDCQGFVKGEEIFGLVFLRSSSFQVPEIHKFDAMLRWAKNHIRKQSYSNKVEAKIDFRACMERLSRDLKLYKISPNDLIKEQLVWFFFRISKSNLTHLNSGTT